MATDATGVPTTLGIPKFLTSADAPSGNGGNAQMDSIDALIQTRVNRPAGVAAGDVPVWNGATFVVPTGTRNGLKFLRDDGSYVYPLVQTLYRAGGTPLVTLSGVTTPQDTIGVNGTGVAVPGGTLGTTGIVRFWIYGHFVNSTGGSVNFTTALGYNGLLAAGGEVITIASSGTKMPFVIMGQLQAAGSTGHQLLMATITRNLVASVIPTATTGAAVWSTTVDSTVSQNLRMTIANDSGAAGAQALIYAATVEVV